MILNRHRKLKNVPNYFKTGFPSVPTPSTCTLSAFMGFKCNGMDEVAFSYRRLPSLPYRGFPNPQTVGQPQAPNTPPIHQLRIQQSCRLQNLRHQNPSYRRLPSLPYRGFPNPQTVQPPGAPATEKPNCARESQARCPHQALPALDC